jgi:hypothetical protein
MTMALKTYDPATPGNKKGGRKSEPLLNLEKADHIHPVKHISFKDGKPINEVVFTPLKPKWK